ncbi:uncharacterized protein BT62DRAFT_931315 [Guyanagaster necrorhizus]|uniref:Uncharacterized protein n=1 Tax=Guyanagaster necrorhizus TaxID=856835 RepID=A0A9P7VVP3_9AGAR|nr:uncharacterized protein BT62DRAFT_931315 [Guyanagaster necrorhizus MCA 3950]KAG7446741.1 hypothetical protein BT62DRAFT_931315 [Guyanagaster necrorhizus MCA 3950]
MITGELLHREETSSYTGSERRCLVAFYVLQLAGFGGLLTILLTGIFSPTVAKRHVCWLNFIITWMASAISYSLLVGHSMDWEPPHGLCLTQAILIYSVPTLTTCTTTALVIHVSISMNALLSPPSGVHFNWTPFLYVMPYLASGGMAALSLAIGLQDPDTVARRESRMYCNFANRTPSHVSSALVAGIMVLCLLVEIFVLVKLRKNWMYLRKKRDRQTISSILRVLAFSAVGCMAIGLGFVFVFTSYRGPALNLILGSVPLLAVLLFGTQQDILDSWFYLFRGKQKPKTENLSLHYSNPSWMAPGTSRDPFIASYTGTEG